ncbi:hypothetical protein Q5P01_008542 [Channa striata]|uniref:Uncharacterized protein n=1 Tax=Channa striata TaxID=64152 RepID=A0AA88N6Z0_CHASR|nr:hypothetical protein Q5P01_008542 [Channa striata]
MFQVAQVCVRRRLWRTGCFATLRPLGAGFGRGPGLGLIRQLCNRDRKRIRSCTVDPNLEEQFVFLDCTDPEKDPHQRRKTSSNS